MPLNCAVYKNIGRGRTSNARCRQHRLLHLYKIINELTLQYLRSLIPQRIQNISRYPLRNMNDLIVPNARTVLYANSFLPSTIRDWNSLDLNIRNSPSLNTFKLQINRSNEDVPIHPKFFDIIHTTRTGQIYHYRLRLECSSLKHHLFNRNIVGDSYGCVVQQKLLPIICCHVKTIEIYEYVKFTLSNHHYRFQNHYLEIQKPHMKKTVLFSNRFNSTF